MTSPPYWGLRDYGTEPIIFDGKADCGHEWIKGEHAGDIRFRGENSIVGNNKNPEIWIRPSRTEFVSRDITEVCPVCNKEFEGKPGQKFCSIKCLNTLSNDERTKLGGISNFCIKCGAWRGQLGLEPTPELFIKHLLDFFDDVKTKLKDEGNCFVNLGDTYYGSMQGYGQKQKSANGFQFIGDGQYCASTMKPPMTNKHDILQAKSLCMIPQRFAWGMIERGWILRNEIIWAKPNHMPESVTDRMTKAHEVIWHFVKQGKYYYNLDAIREPHVYKKYDNLNLIGSKCKTDGDNLADGINWIGRSRKERYSENGKNPGDVWNITTQPYPESHFAVFPLELVRKPILAGCPAGGTVLDPFAGSGTVGEFCRHNDRNAILFELNPAYKPLIEDRAMLNISELSEWG